MPTLHSFLSEHCDVLMGLYGLGSAVSAFLGEGGCACDAIREKLFVRATRRVVSEPFLPGEIIFAAALSLSLPSKSPDLGLGSLCLRHPGAWGAAGSSGG